MLPELSTTIPCGSLKLAWAASPSVWNALVLEAWGRGDNYLDQARLRIAGGLPQFMPMFEMLVESKAVAPTGTSTRSRLRCPWPG